MVKKSKETRNIFNSVALTSRLEGLIPWFLQPPPDPEGGATLSGSISINLRETIYESQRKVIIHGLERTGTGYCSELIRKNVRNVLVEESVKHRAFNKEVGTGSHPYYYVGSNLIKYVICVKNPYSWILSYETYHRKRCQGRIPGVTTLTYPSTVGNHLSYVKTFNSLYGEWLKKCCELYECIIIRYEDILQYPEESLTLLCSKLNLQRKESFTEVSEYINNFSGYSGLNGFSRKDYYIKKQYVDNLTSERIDTINKWIDRSLVYQLGYRLEI